MDDLRAELESCRDAHAEYVINGDATLKCACGAVLELGGRPDHMTDALLRFMRSKLAQAYAHGFRANAPHTPDEQIATRNPWEQEVRRG